MGGLAAPEDIPEPLRWIRTMEERRHPPLNNLVNICCDFVAKHLEECLLIEDPHPVPSPQTMDVEHGSSDDEEFVNYSSTRKFKLRPDVCLPLEVSQNLWNFCSSHKKDDFTSTFYSFGHLYPPQPNPLPLATLDFSFPNRLNTKLLVRYLRTQGKSLEALNISGCSSISPAALIAINRHCPQLKSLVVGKAVQIFLPRASHDESQDDTQPILTGPKALRKLVVHSVRGELIHDYFDEFYQRLVGQYKHTLTYLDVSNCDIGSFMFLASLKVLKSLLLYNVDLKQDDLHGFFSILPCISKDIRHLDLSQSGSRLATTGNFRNPNQLLDSIATNLVELQFLDLSGTNLAGDGVAQRVNPNKGELCCDIPGLNSRSSRPLEYLGLYGSAHDASHRHCIPAKIVGGDKDELQILNAARFFLDRQEVLEKILNDLFHLFRTEDAKMVSESLRLILLAMECHPTEKHIQISGSAILFYIVKNNQNLDALNAMSRRILSAIVTAMELHVTDSTMMRNGCLTICHFKIPQDVMFIYEKLVRILLETLGGTSNSNNEEFNERIAIYLLNSLACQVEGDHKRLVGNLGAIQKMLTLIEGRLRRGDCDDVMEIAWSTMWNVTDETPENCAKFLEHNGMSLFLQCLQKFHNQPELLRNMMGLLGNVAEVKELRSNLMTEAFIQVFYDLLNSKQDNIEVSYNAAGVLAHILSDGVESWKGVATPTREDVCDRMSQNIKEWDLHSQRNINYRSFKPILRLLLVPHTVQCKLWAAWALANLTTVYPEKYVKLLEEEEGLVYLAKELKSEESEDLAQYATLAFNNVVNQQNETPKA